MKKIIVLILMIAVMGISCKSPSGPDPIPPIEPTKYYHLEILYTRVAVRDNSAINFIPMAIFGIPDGTVIEKIYNFSKIGNLKFQVSLSKNPFAAGFYCVTVGDPALYDGINKGSCITGVEIEIRVVETGVVYALLSIVPNIFSTLVYSTEISTMARFVLKGDGTIEDF